VLPDVASVAAEVFQKVPAHTSIEKHLELLTVDRTDDDGQLRDPRTHALSRRKHGRVEVDTRSHGEQLVRVRALEEDACEGVRQVRRGV